MEKIRENCGKKIQPRAGEKIKKNKKFLEKGGVNYIPANRCQPTPILQEYVFINH